MNIHGEDEFYKKHSCLAGLSPAIRECVKLLAAIQKPNKVMVCGNGGSSADSFHIVGELMKEFKQKRPLAPELARAFGGGIGGKLQGAIPAISLCGETALITAMINDVGAEYMYAQQVYGLGFAGDVLIGISTSGNAASVVGALHAARALGVTTVGMTGGDGGQMAALCDILLNVPETKTDQVQELHLPLYHFICAAAEYRRFCE